MRTLTNRLGYAFRDPGLLETALTHPSYGMDHRVPHYQRLEFLGDAVLELSVSIFLYEHFPDVDEGKLTRIRAALVCEENLSEAAKRLSLGSDIRMSVGEERSGGRQKASILSDVMEAVFAAVYIDAGFETAKALIYRVLGEDNLRNALNAQQDAKSELQMHMQKQDIMPVYNLIGMEGPPHAPTFIYEVTDGQRVLGVGSGNSKKTAQQAAAQEALKGIGAESTTCD